MLVLLVSSKMKISPHLFPDQVGDVGDGGVGSASAGRTGAVCYGSINLRPRRTQTIAYWCFKLVSPVCVSSSPLRSRRSPNWSHSRKKKQHLHSERNTETGGTVIERSLQQRYTTITPRVVLPNVNIYIPDSPTWPRSPLSGSRWRPPLFPGSPAARPSTPPSPSSPLAAPLGLRPRLPAPATCLSGGGKSLCTLTRRINDGNAGWDLEPPHRAWS